MTEGAERVELRFFAGTLELRGLSATAEAPPRFGWDAREACFRAPAYAYAQAVLWLRDRGIEVDDQARRYPVLDAAVIDGVELPPARPFQTEAIEAWRRARGRGVVVLPTGAGKTHVGVRAIAQKQRAALVVAPTLDLVRQWRELLASTFATAVGAIGGGEHEVLPLTVATYDSAWAHMEHYGARFGLVIFDEVHHLAAESYAIAARHCIAPYRLGLSATPERADGRDALLDDLLGPIVYRKEIDELEGAWLSEYDTERVEVTLSDDDRAAYQAARAIYVGFLRDQGINLGDPRGWSTFIMRSARSPEGREAFAAYRRQRALAVAAPQKLDAVEEILERHAGQRTLIFTDDNATAYAVARRFLVPVITHQTKLKERTAILRAFADGTWPILSTSRMLNEGIDVPDAQVAVVVSGTGSVREHVQRLGRVLRKRDGKRAVLYEIVSAGTGEEHTSERRRQHLAYR
jgi:superfamily II DNA or RNA helicase